MTGTIDDACRRLREDAVRQHRADLSEWFWRLGVHSEIGERQVALGDDEGMARTTRQLVTYTRAAVATLAALQAAGEEPARGTD